MNIDKHIIFFVHGLDGSSADFRIMINYFKERFPHLILISCTSNDQFFITHYGIDKCGVRVANEIETISNEVKPSKISIVSHSLGGLISRYAIGVLYESGYFNRVKPIQFISLSSPHCGSRRPNRGIINRMASMIASHMYDITGRQLMISDDDRNPLLLEISRPESRYYKGFKIFQDRSLYSTIANDLQVNFNTSNITHKNPYSGNPTMEVKLSEKYPHFIDTQSIAEYTGIPDGDDSFKNDEKGPILREMLRNLQTLNYSRYHMKFSNFLSHTHVVMKREWLNGEGADVIHHLMDHLIV